MDMELLAMTVQPHSKRKLTENKGVTRRKWGQIFQNVTKSYVLRVPF